jgi:hypothetical protein
MILILTDNDYIKTDDGKEYLGYEISKAYYNSELVLRQTGEGNKIILTVIAFRPTDENREKYLKEKIFKENDIIWGEYK